MESIDTWARRAVRKLLIAALMGIAREFELRAREAGE